MSFTVGLDLGQKGDYSALILLDVAPAEKAVPGQPIERNRRGVVTRMSPATEAKPAMYVVRAIHRWPLGVSWTSQVADVADMLRRPGERQRAKLIIDETGVGNAVVEMVRAAGLTYEGVTILGTGETHRVPGGWHVLKRDLVAAVEVVVEQHRFKIVPDLPLAKLLTDELDGFRRKRLPSGHVRLEAGDDWRTAPHDDICLATALAVWHAMRPQGWARLWEVGPGWETRPAQRR